VLRDRRIWYLGALATLLGPLDEDFLAFLIAYLERGRGLSPSLSTAVASASVVGTLVGFASTSRAGYRASRSTLRNHAATAAFAAVVAAAVPSVPVVAAAVFVFGFAVARYWIALKTRIVATHPGRVGAVHAVVSTIELSGFVLPLLAGALADAFGVRAGFAFSAVIAVVMLLVVLAGGRQASSERAI
jgi:fucose permease